MAFSRPLPRRALTLALLAAGCSGAAPDRPADGAASGDAQSRSVTTQAPDSLRFSLVMPQEVRAGQRVPVTLRAENVGGRPLELSLRGRTIAFDVVVSRADGEVVWRRLEGEIIPAILRLEVLAPGRVLELRAEWDQRTNGGLSVGTGRYVVRGLLLTDAEPWETPPAPLRIVTK
jgi:hypothetical protein